MATQTITSMQYPIICPTLPDPSEMQDMLKSIFDSGRVTVGKQVSMLENDVCAYTGVRNTVAVSSGTAGLMLLLRALNLPEGSEVIVPSFTFAATAHALLWNGLKPVFCDSEPLSFTMDVCAAEQLINERTSAIYPVCIFGVPGNIGAYRDLAEKNGLALLFDSAQGLGSTYKGTVLGNFGNGEVFSLSPTKVVTAMEGGLVTTNDNELAGRIRYMRDYGKAPDGEDMQWLGLSARMGEINAAVGRWSLDRIETWISNRQAITDRYRKLLGEIPGLSFQQIPSCCTSSLNYMVILLDPDVCVLDRDALYSMLKDRGVQTKRYFYPALHRQTLYRDMDPNSTARLSVAERISSQSLALPMYSHMSMHEVVDICEIISECIINISN